MPKNGSNALKRAVRARMAETGENYTTALSHIQEQRESAQQGLQDSRDARDRLVRQRADVDRIAEAERLVAIRERELAAVERLMTEPAQGGNEHRGRTQARHVTGPRP